MRHPLIILALFLLTLAGCSRREIDPSDTISRAEILLLHNRERARAKVEPLAMDHDLEVRAQAHAEWMARNNSLTHSRLGGDDWSTMGENIAMGYDDVESVVDGWMHSSGHRRNILNRNFTHAGFGYAKQVGGRPYWCSVFGGGQNRSTR